MSRAELDQVVRVLSTCRAPLTDEKRTQQAIEEALMAAGLAFKREARLSAQDIPDFMVGPVAVEVKIKGPRMAMYRQVARYAQHANVRAVVLATSVSIRLPEQIDGKPAAVVSLGAAWL